MAKAHVLVLPLPAQGHVTPLMELSHRLVDHGFEVTFITTEERRALVVGALQPAGGMSALASIHLASIPDGVANDEDRKDIGKVIDAQTRHIPGHLERLIAGMEAAGRPKVRWLVSDVFMWWSSDVAKKFGIRVAAFWPSSVACFAINLKIPKLTEEGIILINNKVSRSGRLARAGRDTLQLAPGIPHLHTSQLPWNTVGAPEWPALAIFFELLSRSNALAEMVVCNSFHDAEAGAFKLFPNVLPIGPLSSERKPPGQFLPEDAGCLEWLDAQPNGSVVYVAFGSLAIFDRRQFVELAEGLELTGRPFLWVVRPDFTPGLSETWLDEFQQRVAGKGMIVSWCSQQQVLAHRSVACFVSHCCWNSTLEGVRNGVPFLCWPYFADQYIDQSYIANVWRTGLAVSPNVDGIVTKEEVRSKVEQVVGEAEIKERARLFKDAACRCLSEAGSSYENFNKFVKLLRDEG